MLLVDTNILVSLVIDNNWTNMAQMLHQRDTDWHTECHALVELTNVMVRYQRNKLMTSEEALLGIAKIERAVRPQIHNVTGRDAFLAAIECDCSAYDARFLVVARHSGMRLVTEDRKLRIKAPGLTQSLEKAVGT